MNLWPNVRMKRAPSPRRKLDLGWSALAHLPSQELTRLSPAEIQAHYQGKLDHSYGEPETSLTDAQQSAAAPARSGAGASGL
ncbi:MAG: hypothetical protein R2911_05700 [Caldilineaceae bacterium]